MSLAGLMSSYDPARQFGNLTAGTVTTTDSLTVKGVPITGLLSSGAPESAYSAQMFVQTEHDVSGAYTPSGVLTTNSYTSAASFSDVVMADGTGAWSYSYPVLFKTPPVLTLTPLGGSAGPLLDQYDVSGASGYMRFASSQSRFLISGSGAYIGPPAVAPFSGFDTSPVVTTVLTATGQFQNFGTLTLPADLDPSKPVTITASYAPIVGAKFVQGSVPSGYNVAISLALVPNPGPTDGLYLFWGSSVPAGATASTFASQSWNQYENTVALGVQPGVTYYVVLSWGLEQGSVIAPSPNPQTLQTQISITNIAYYPTGAPPSAAPMSVAPSSMTVTGGRSRFRR
jgi:hypothetical protein